MRQEKIRFPNEEGQWLDARLERPDHTPSAFAIFAHCFTCSKDIAAASRISSQLAEHGFGVLRFDFTGLGNSEGDFGNTNFSSNKEDLLAAATFLRQTYQAPDLLIGHSLGGAAVLAVAPLIPEVDGVVTIGAPADPEHVTHLFASSRPEIESKGSAESDLSRTHFQHPKTVSHRLRRTKSSPSRSITSASVADLPRPHR